MLMFVCIQALFALACLLRHCPFAQSHFLKLGGLQVLGDLFRASEGGALRVRIVTILYDMINEKVSGALMKTLPINARLVL